MNASVRILLSIASVLLTPALSSIAQDANRITLEAATRAKCLQVAGGRLRGEEFWPAMHAAEGLTLGGHGSEVIEYLSPKQTTETDDQHFCGIAREIVRAGDPSAFAVLLPFKVQAQAVFSELNAKSCWFHPRVAALPGHGKEGQPAVVMTIQKHLGVSDHYSGLYFLRTDDLGETWTGPLEIPELASQPGENDETIAVCDVTPGWLTGSGKLLAIGIKLRYSPQGEQLLDKPRSHECAYAIYDPETDKWTAWKMLAMPETDGRFFLVSPGCVQWLEQADGTLLIPTYFQGPSESDYTATVLHCSFDGQELKYLAHGDELTMPGERGFVEPSLAHFHGRYYLTLRNDAAAYVTTSDDGLHFQPVRKWTFDDGDDLGSYNTQAHWLTHSGGLFLTYTRRGANNDHITRNRAPIFVAQVDPETLQVLRRTEQPLLPERGVMLGNFGAAAITPGESWVTDAEYLISATPHSKGADGTVWLGRVKWSKPNQLVK